MNPTRFKFRSREHVFAGAPAVMGILNATPDSFSDGGEHCALEAAVEHARRMIDDGADFIDVGGESTRPGFAAVPAAEEIRRTVPVIRAIREFSDVPISIDTRKAAVAEAALEAGADIVNDVEAFRDPGMPEVVARYSAGSILMDSEALPPEADAVSAVRSHLAARLERALSATRLGRECFLLDPGVGFGKTREQDLEVVRRCDAFRIGGVGVLVGMSRKSFLGRILGIEDPRGRLAGSLAAALYCAERGCEALRVHDVRETAQALACREALRGGARRWREDGRRC